VQAVKLLEQVLQYPFARDIGQDGERDPRLTVFFEHSPRGRPEDT